MSPRARSVVAALFLTTALSGLAPTVASAAPGDEVTFDDPVFRTCVAANLGQRSTTAITQSQAASLTSVDCGELSPASLAGAEALTNLTSLSMSYGSTVSTLQPLAGLTALRELDVPSGRVGDLSPVRGLTALTSLDVSGNPVTDLAPLSRLTALTTLDITGTTWTTLEPLRPLTRLRRLSADQEGQVDISALGALTGLQQLTLTVPDVRSIAPLRTLTGLTRLTLQAAATDVSALAPLTRLQSLSVNVPGGDGSALAGKPDLTELSVYGLRLPSLSVLAASTNLTWLVVASSGVKDVSTLQRLTQLSEVILSGLDRADLSPLGRLPQLSYLSVSESRLGPLSQLTGFPVLDTLALNDDQLATLSGFRVPASLTSLDVSGNHLADVSAMPCSLLVNALAQTFWVGRARAGQPYRLPVTSIRQQSVRLASSSSWTSSGTRITYAAAGSYRVPFVAVSPPECSGVQFAGVAAQSAVEWPPSRRPHDR